MRVTLEYLAVVAVSVALVLGAIRPAVDAVGQALQHSAAMIEGVAR